MANSSLPVTMGGASLALLGMLLYTLFCGGLTMLVSAVTRNTMAALIAPVLLMIGQSALRLDCRLDACLPNHVFSIHNMFCSVRLLPSWGGYLTVAQTACILYVFLTVTAAILCWPGWRRNAAG